MLILDYDVFQLVVTCFYVRYTLSYRWIAFATNVYSSLITSEDVRMRRREATRERKRGNIKNGGEWIFAIEIYEITILLLANDIYINWQFYWSNHLYYWKGSILDILDIAMLYIIYRLMQFMRYLYFGPTFTHKIVE